MQADILIIGGGLSGLMAAWQLNRAGADALLLEARDRFGGRVWTVGQELGANCDIGPSWFWPGQPIIANLLSHFQIPHYDQYAEGTTLFQQTDGSLVPALPSSPMAGSHRIRGGIGRLVEAIVREIEPSRRLLNHRVMMFSSNDGVVKVEVSGPSGEFTVEATRIALAIPPRHAAELTFEPALPSTAIQTLATTPTWMAGHAKFFAIYDAPFWRSKGLCGSAISRLGPLAEIHDASPEVENVGVLFGFAGVDAQSRAILGRDAFIQAAKEQLGAIFGEEAKNPIQIYFHDWSTEPFTANSADQQPQTKHPQYGLNLNFGDVWGDRLAHISSESSYLNGGLIEGALESGLVYAKELVDSVFPLANDSGNPHRASMDWDWL